LEIRKVFSFRNIKILLLLAGFSTLSYAQQIKLSGKVTDTLQNPLPNANILAIPQADDRDIKFAILTCKTTSLANRLKFITNTKC
jgi:hypothetical protein